MNYFCIPLAQMAELVDALDSKSGYRKVVQVRFLFWAQKNPQHLLGIFYLIIAGCLPAGRDSGSITFFGGFGFWY